VPSPTLGNRPGTPSHQDFRAFFVPVRTIAMRVFLTGATGFIGQHLLHALADRGHVVTCLARGAGAAALRAMELPGVAVVAGEFTAPVSYLSHVAGHDVVINSVGI